jgi:hypothetical protein
MLILPVAVILSPIIILFMILSSNNFNELIENIKDCYGEIITLCEWK